MTKALLRDSVRGIKTSFSRFLSIVIILALGTGIFVGIKAVSPDMKLTAQKYFSDKSFADIFITFQMGLTDDDAEAIKGIDSIKNVTTVKVAESFLSVNNTPEFYANGSAYVCRAFSMDFSRQNDTDYLNRLMLVEGRFPTSADECVADASSLAAPKSFSVGATVSLTDGEGGAPSALAKSEFKIVGLVATPLYISYQRGNSSIGSGKLGTFVFVDESAFTADYFAAVYATVNGADRLSPYSDEYTALVSSATKSLAEIADGHAVHRIETVKTEYADTLKNGREKLDEQRTEIETQLAETQKQLLNAEYYAEHIDEIISQQREAAEKKLAEGQKEYDDGMAEYNAALAEYNTSLAEYNTAIEYVLDNPGYKLAYNLAVAALGQRELLLTQGEDATNAVEKYLSNSDAGMPVGADDEAAWKTQENLLKTLRENLTPLYLTRYALLLSDLSSAIAAKSVSDFTTAKGALRVSVSVTKDSLKSDRADYEKTKAELDSRAEYIEMLTNLNSYGKELTAAKKELDATHDLLETGKKELDAARASMEEELNQARSEIELAAANSEEAKRLYEEKKALAYAELDKAEKELDDIEKLIATSDDARWTVSDRTALAGYSEYARTAENVQAFATVFPVFFFLVAALVSLSAITAMVRSERKHNGTLMALGYSSSAVAARYAIYALSASILGSAIGTALGFSLLPVGIFKAYGLVYLLPDISLRFYWRYALIAFLFSAVATLGASLPVCLNELRASPSALMRPKPPQKGHRVLLERVPFVWRRLSFISKLAVRNLFRSKRRFLMTVAGTAGCTALVFAGLGLGVSISSILGRQYGDDGICTYDAQIVPAAADNSELINSLKAVEGMESVLLTYTHTVTVGAYEAALIVPEQSELLPGFVRLQSRTDGTNYTLDDSGIIVTEKLAVMNGLSVGSLAELTYDGVTASVPVAGITENYIYHYVYVSPGLFAELFDEPEFNGIMAGLADNIKDNDSEKAQLAENLIKTNTVSAVVYTSDISRDFGNTVTRLSSIIAAVFTVSASALAAVVLYNLSDINLGERAPELSAFRVLGFYEREMRACVYRESRLMTIPGTAVGLLLGIPLHQYIVATAEVSEAMFVRETKPEMYAIAAAVTLLLSIIVRRRVS